MNKETVKKYSDRNYINDLLSKYNSLIKNEISIISYIIDKGPIEEHNLYSTEVKFTDKLIPKESSMFSGPKKLYLFKTPFYTSSYFSLQSKYVYSFYDLVYPTKLIGKRDIVEKDIEVLTEEYNDESKIISNVIASDMLGEEYSKITIRDYINDITSLKISQKEIIKEFFDSQFENIIVTNVLSFEHLDMLKKLNNSCIIYTFENSSMLEKSKYFYKDTDKNMWNLLHILPFVGTTQELLDMLPQYAQKKNLYLLLNNTGFNYDNIFQTRTFFNKICIIEGLRKNNTFKLRIYNDNAIYVKPKIKEFIKMDSFSFIVNKISIDTISLAMLSNMFNIMVDGKVQIMQTFNRETLNFYNHKIVFN